MARTSILCYIVAVLCLQPIRCARNSTEEFLSAKALANGQAPPQLIAPADGENVPLTTLLRFSGIAVNITLLEIDDNSAFSNPIVQLRLPDGAQTYAFTAPQSRTYFWRFRGAVDSAMRSFNAGEGIYVNAVATAPGSGTKLAPYTSLQTALLRAQAANLPVFAAAGDYHETLNFPAGVKAYGGYSAATWLRDSATLKSRLIAQNTGGHTATNIYEETTIDGFVFTSSIENGSTRLFNALGSAARLKITNCDFAPTSGSSNQAHDSILCSVGCKIRIEGNTFHSPLNADYYSGILVQQGSSPTIVNNIFVLHPTVPSVSVSSQGYAGVRIERSNDTVMTNNLFIATARLANGMMAGDAESMSGIYLHESGGGGIIANNVAYALKGVRHFSFVHTGNNDLIFPASLENNAYYFHEGASGCNSLFTYRPTSSSGACRIYHDPVQTLAALHGLAGYLAGSDKGRGNYILPVGSAGKFIRNLPESAMVTQVDGPDAARLVLDKRDDNTTPCASILPVGTYLEWNHDGIARQITACEEYFDNPQYHYRYTVNPPLDSDAMNKEGVEVFHWGAISSGYNWDFQFEQKSLAAGDWNTLRYGGKDTAGNNCGAPAGGPGTGAGAQYCGNATRDRAGTPRTTGNESLSANTGGTGAVRNGFSIGPWELD